MAGFVSWGLHQVSDDVFEQQTREEREKSLPRESCQVDDLERKTSWTEQRYHDKDDYYVYEKTYMRREVHEGPPRESGCRSINRCSLKM
jgi:hypothetical protein